MATDFDYDVNQAKLHATESGDDDDDIGQGFDMDDVKEEDTETVSLEDDEPMLPEKEEEDEEEKEVADKPAPKKKDSEEQPDTTQDDKIKADVLKIVGNDAVLTIKGVDRKVADLTPQEIKNYLQKSIRADQSFNETAAWKKQLEAERQKLEADRALVERAAATVQDYLLKLEGKPKANQPNVEALLKINEDDPEETVALKSLLGNTLERLNRIEGKDVQSSQERKVAALISDVESFRTDYPMASADEVLAIKAVRPEVDTEALMKASHEYYSGEGHIAAALNANPEAKRKYDEYVIQNYLAQKAKTKTVPGLKSGASSVDKVSTKASKPPRDFNAAEDQARAFLKDLRKASSE